MLGGVGSSGRREGGLCASHSTSWVCWAGFEDLRPKAASPCGTPREGSGSLSYRTVVTGHMFVAFLKNNAYVFIFPVIWQGTSINNINN